jgi:radical SAM protein with 4Fe4S-binding SPASM domain
MALAVDVGTDQFVAALQAQSEHYHSCHPFHVAMNEGRLSPEQIRGWVANRFYYQKSIPLKDAQIVGLPHQNVREQSLAWIWEESKLFNQFRGTEWMTQPCRSCPRRTVDVGGCRCQAFQLTGDAARSDPVCHLALDHDLVARIVQVANEQPSRVVDYAYRSMSPADAR